MQPVKHYLIEYEITLPFLTHPKTKKEYIRKMNIHMMNIMTAISVRKDRYYPIRQL